MLDLAIETEKLRQRQPFQTSRLLCFTAVIFTFNIVLLVPFLTIEKLSQSDIYFYLLIFSFLISGAILIAVWRQINLLIREGIVLDAEILDIRQRLSRDYGMVSVSYRLDCEQFVTTYRIACHQVSKIEKTGAFYVVAVPRKPRIVEPLYMLAKFGKESENIISHQSGLQDTSA